ncbi:MAG: hypothetical protein AAFP89_16955 [Bacteroidota bacterium]
MRYRSTLLMLIGICLCTLSSVYGQFYQRVEADFTIKEQLTDSLSNLTFGRAYYDLGQGKLIYRVKFPEREIWGFQDSIFYRKTADTTLVSASDAQAVRTSIFHLVLSGDLDNFGLPDTIFQKADVTREEGQIITTFQPIPPYDKVLGAIYISKERKVVTGVIITDKEEKILGKQFFRKYDMTLPLPFPQELIQITYRKGKAYYRITTFENIQYNVRDDEEWYAYPMPNTVGGTE